MHTKRVKNTKKSFSLKDGTMRFNENKHISLKSILVELFEQEEAGTGTLAGESQTPSVEFPTWLESKIKEVHGKPGQGSIFKNPDSIKQLAMDVIKNNIDKIPEIAKSNNPFLTANVSGIGYDLVIPIEEAKQLENAEIGETEKVEGPNKIKVPMVKTSASIEKFTTNELTIVVRPKKDQSGAELPNEYIILSAFPGKNLPRASEWGGKYAVIVPDQSATEGTPLKERFDSTRWKRLANIIKD